MIRKLIPLTLGSTNRPSSSVQLQGFQILRRTRDVPHLQRKAYHLVMGLACFFLYRVMNRTEALAILAIAGTGFVLADVARLRFPQVNAAAFLVFGRIMRRNELKSLSGNSFYILGLFLIVLLFSKPICLISILLLAVGDPVAAVVGTLYGKTPVLGKKSWEGAVGNFIASFLVVWIASQFLFQLNIADAICLASVAAAVGTLAELAPVSIDDNFTIPVTSALLLFLLSPWLPSIH